MDDDRNAPASKADLAELETRLTADSAELKADIAQIRADLAEREDRLTEVIRDSQTEVLRAFYGFVETISARLKAQDDTEAGLKKRLTLVEERLFEVEKRLNMPPAA